jgi:hypothetical protein
VLAAIEASIGHWLPVQIVSLESDRRRTLQDRLLSDDQLKAAQLLCLHKIEKAVEAPSGLGQRLGCYLYRWKEWGGEQAARTWVASQVSTLPGAVVFLEGFLRTIYQSVSPYVRYDISLRQIEMFVDVSVVQAVLEPLMAVAVPGEHAELLENHKTAITAFSDAVRRRHEGRPDDDWRHDEP